MSTDVEIEPSTPPGGAADSGERQEPVVPSTTAGQGEDAGTANPGDEPSPAPDGTVERHI